MIMGILNVTPDSFSDGGRYDVLDRALAHADEMEAEGADIIDVGGESTRPGHAAVPEADEIARIKPVLLALRQRTRLPISIDTYKSATARVALELGADIVNDIWGLQRDPEIARVAADHGAPVIIMHNRTKIDGTLDIVDDMKRFFATSIAIAHAAGIPDADIILDPGIGFGKTLAQQFDAIRGVAALKALGFPVLVGGSRKSFIAKTIASGRSTPSAEAPKSGAPGSTHNPPDDRLIGSIAAHVMSLAAGADILRVHDVRAHVEAAMIADVVTRRHSPI